MPPSCNIAQRRQSVSPGKPVRVETLHFQQGAFGYSPRIVILKDEETLFDKSVPFLTEREGQAGISFSNDFSLEEEGLQLSGRVNLESLDGQMRGHPRLDLEISKNGAVIGRGDLLPGHFAEMKEGYRVGFAGLEKWSEIDITRRNYPEPVMAGLALLVIGLLVWPIAAWRRW
jgi:hypothetical protein